MDKVIYKTSEELEAQVETIRRAPKDEGKLLLIVCRPDLEEREVLEKARLDLEQGLVGDSWRKRVKPKAHEDELRRDNQITVMNARVTDLLTQDQALWPLAGDQLFVDFDLSQENIPPGTRLAIGGAVIEVSALPHTGCKKFAARFGMDALTFVNSPVGRELQMRGINAQVVQEGQVQPGDAVRKVSDNAGR